MIERYSRNEMALIWSDENRYNTWLQVELAACEAWCHLGVIPRHDMEQLAINAKIDLTRMIEIERETKHDVIAFTRAVSESLGEERKWVHYGLTSTDVVDTAQGVILKQANVLLRHGLEKIISTLTLMASKHKYTAMIGRTHGVHAEPTTFGLKLALWREEMLRNMRRFQHASEGVEFGKVSGAVGTYANVDPQVEALVCNKLGIQAAPISTQVLQRDRHAEYISTLAIIATSLDKFCTEIRNLQRTEIREVEEPFGSGQKGSSAMPHKKNPIGCEGICGLARVVRGFVTPALEDMVLWHERDISHSSVERIILPDATLLVDYMLERFNNILAGMTVNVERMRNNIFATKGVVFSGRVLTTLIDSGYNREEAYDMVQRYAMESWNLDKSFKDLLLADTTIIRNVGLDRLEECFNEQWHMTNVDHIFQSLGL